MKSILFSFIFSLIAAYSFAQGVTVSGKVTDKKTSQPVSFAQILLVSLPDSAVTPTQADLEGNFSFPVVANGRYAVKVLFVGYKPLRRIIQVNGQPVNLGTVTVEEAVESLKQVEVVGKAATAIQKGDTSEFNSKAFKTNPDASAEDLVQKIPGVTMQNGKVQAQGEEVKRVLVDGKEFFGDDPTAALRNLPAEVISKIQVFDQLSDQSRLTGFNDGNTTKTINIITKPDMRNGKFGKVYAGGGTDDRYQAGGSMNFMNGDQRITVIGQTNNVNQQNFASEDLVGVSSGGGGGRGGRGGGRGPGGPGGFGGGGASDFQVAQSNGIARTHAFGLNYANQWGKNLKVSGSYFFNASNNLSNQFLIRNFTTTRDSGQVYSERNLANADNINHRVNARIEWEIDSANSLIFTPRLSLQQNQGTSNFLGRTFILSQEANSNLTNLNTDLTGINFSGNLRYQHKFAKRGRTISLGLSSAQNGTDGERFLISDKLAFRNGVVVNSNRTDQYSELNNSNPTYGGQVDYTEPISRNSSLSLNYEASLRLSEADQKTFDYSEDEKGYTTPNTGLSNVFSSNYLTQEAGAGYRYNAKDIQFNTRVNYQYATLKSEQELPFQTKIDRPFSSVLPMAMLRYNLTKDKNIRLFYRTSTNAPSVTQLQNVVDNSNPSLLRIGNPDLVQDYRHMLFMRYSSAKPEKSTNFFGLLSAEFARNYIANNTITDRQAIADIVARAGGGVNLQGGEQLTRPVNVDGYYRLRSFATYGMPISFIKSNLNLNASAIFTHAPGLIDTLENFANTQSYGFGAVLSSNISENLDFTISGSPTYNVVHNTLQPNADNNYFNLNSGLRLNWIIWKGLFLQSEINHQYYSGLSAGIEQNYLLWNAAVGKKLFKNNRGEIKLTAFDLLKQNNSIQRNVTETYIEDIETNVLQQYFMLVFTYNIRSFGSGSKTPAPADSPEGTPTRQRRGTN